MSDNWVVQNLENALETWNEKLSEIWTLITTTPQNFKGGNIWKVIVDINGAVQAIGLALLVLFFVIGMVKTCGSFTDVKKPEHALKLFVRFALAKGVITYGMELMLALFNIVQGTISTIMNEMCIRDRYQALADVIAYAKDEEKTEREFYVEGINCNVAIARDQFITVKEQYQKTDGIQAYHGYLSFKEIDISPEMAQKIGMEFANEVWGKRFQVVVKMCIRDRTYSMVGDYSLPNLKLPQQPEVTLGR